MHVNMAYRRSRTLPVGLATILNVLAVLSTLCFMCASVRAEIRSVVIDKQTGKLSVLEGYREDFVAWANFTDDIKTSG